MYNNMHVIGLVRTHINRLKSTSQQIESLLNALEKDCKLMLFGGAIRDIIFGFEPRDYDIVLYSVNKNIEECIGNFTYKRNSFGGYKFTFDSIKIDVWALENTWAFKEHLIECQLNNLVKTVFFNADAISIDLVEGTLYDNGFTDMVDSKVLKILLRDNPYPDLCVLRAFVLKMKYSLEFSDDIREYIRHWTQTTPDPVNALINIQLKHYQNMIYSGNDIAILLQPYLL